MVAETDYIKKDKIFKSKFIQLTWVNRIYTNVVKRVLDVSFSVVGLTILIVPFAIISILIKCTSKGPVFFRQLRAGKRGKFFVMFKFRTMIHCAPVVANKDLTSADMGHYVTKLGRFLRRTSLDELPQLFNVLKGNMSLIGPRPLATTDSTVLELRKKSGADQVLPGISGLAQVHGRNNLSDIEKAEWDHAYARNISMKMDCKIVFSSIRVILSQTGINHESNI